MTCKHYYRTDHEHCSALANPVEEASENRGKDHRKDREAAEKTSRRCSIDCESLLEEVGRIPLEREYCAIVENAEKGDNPEHFALEDSSEVADMELILRGFLLCCKASLDELRVKLAIHDAEDDEIDKTYHEKGAAEAERSDDRAAEMIGDNRCNPHDREDAEAGDSHLQPHCKGHFLTLEPLCEDLRDICPLHLAAAAENHESEGGHFGAGGHFCPP